MRKILSLLTAFLFAASMMAADPVEIASSTFNGSAGTHAEGWSTTGTGVGRSDCVIIGADENITSPEVDLSNYESITVQINSRRYGTLSGKKADIAVTFDGEAIGTVSATGTSATTALDPIEYTVNGLSTGQFVFTCTNATSAGSTHGAGINSIVVTGIEKSGEGGDDPQPTTQDLYLKLSSDWAGYPAKYAVYYFKDETDNGWSEFMTAVTGEENTYTATIPVGYSKVIFVRLNGAATEANWDNKWSQTVNLTIPEGKNHFTVTSGGTGSECDGVWAKYPVVPTYYVAGTMTSWADNMVEMNEGSYTFEGLAAGKYEIKVVDNNSNWLGFEVLDQTKSSANIYEGSDGNIKFTLAEAGNVTVAYANSKITVTGTFVAPSTKFTVTVPEGTEKTYIAGNFNNWTPAEMTLKAGEEDVFELTVEGVESDTVAYKYLAGVDWKFVEVIENNRSYNAADEVSAWKAVPTIYKYAKVKEAPVNWTGHYIIAWADHKPHSAIKVGSSSKDDFVAADDALVFTDGDTISIMEGLDFAVNIRFGASEGAYTLQLPDGKYIYLPNTNGVCSKDEATDMYLAVSPSTTQTGIQIGDKADMSNRVIYNNNTNYRSYTNKYETTGYILPTLYRLVDEAFDCQDGPYAILVNGKDVENTVAGEEFDGYKQYVAYLSLSKGDSIQLINTSCGATWLPAIEEGGMSAHFKKGVNAATIDTTGCFDLYIKMKEGDDKLYIGAGICADDTIRYTVRGKGGILGEDFEKAIDSKQDTLELALEAGKYELKVVVGEDWKGFEQLTDTAAGLTVGDQGNICFTLKEDGNVTIVYNASVFKLIGNFYVEPTKYYAKYAPKWEWSMLTEKEGMWLTDTIVYGGIGININDQAADEHNMFYSNTVEEEGVRPIAGAEIAEKDTIYFSFNPADSVVTAVMVGKYVAPVPHYYIAGTMTDWAAHMVEMEAGNVDTFHVALALEADSLYSFKVVKILGTDTTWYGNKEEGTMVYGNSTGWWLNGDANIGLQTTKAGEYQFIFKANENNEISVVIPEPDKEYYAKYAPEWKWAQLTEKEGMWLTDTIVYGGVGININDAAADENNMFYSNTVEEEGVRPIEGVEFAENDTLYFTFNPADSVLTAVMVGKYVAPDPTVGVRGSMNDWADEPIMFALSEDKSYASLKIENISAAEYQFKFIVNGEYRSNGYRYHRGFPGAAGITGNDDANMVFVADQEGEYTFTWFFANDSLAITYPEIPFSCDWDNIAWLDGSNEQIKVCKESEAVSVVNVQKPGWAAENGIYMTFPSAAWGAISLEEGSYVTEGAGLLVYLSALTQEYNEISIVCQDVEYIITIYNAANAPKPVYYLVGTLNEWTAAEAYQFGKDETCAEGEYILHANLTTGDEIKVIGVLGNDTTWFPADAGNYTIDDAHAGEAKAIYFRPQYHDDWADFGGYFWIGENQALLDAPDAAPAAPTYAGYQVHAAYSATYNADCNFGEWGSGTQYTQEEFGKKYVTTNLGYFGLEFTGMDCSEMEALHLDVWVAADASIRIVPIHGGTEVGVTAQLQGQQWNAIDIALTEFAGVTNWSNVYQIKIDNASNLTFWLNNVYFYTTQEKTVDLVDGYYLIGNINGWDIHNLTADHLFAVNPENEAEYKLHYTLAEGNEFKVVAVANNELGAWYPGEAGNYVVDFAHAGENDIYFRPDYQGGADWHASCIYVAVDESQVNPWETWFATGDTWNTETESYLEWDGENQKATVHINVDKYGQWRAQVKYHGPVAEEGKCYHVALKLKANNAISNVTIKYQDNVEMVYVNDAALAANVEFVFDTIVAGLPNGNGVMVLDFGYAHAGDIIEIYDVVIEEAECPAQRLEDGYYLIGLGGWEVTDLDASVMFTVNPSDANEYMLEDITLVEGDKFKAVYVENDAIKTWYPDGQDNDYVVDAAHAGKKTVYFRPTYSEEWQGHFYVAPNEETSMINAEVENVAVKLLQNGQVIIRRGERVYTIMGQLIK